MKRSTRFSLAALIAGALLFGAAANAQERTVNWDAFSKNLVRAIQEGNEGLQQSAMCMIIRYGDYLHVKDARFDIVRIFRSHKNPKVRQLALVTLYKIQDPWAMYFLSRNIRFEKDEAIKKLNCCIVNAYNAKKEAAKQHPEEPLTMSGR